MLQISQWPYLHAAPITGNLESDVGHFLTANGKHETLAHCIAVAKTAKGLALRFGADMSRAGAAALLHDISGVLKPEDMLEYAARHGWPLDDSEKKYPFLLHQRLSGAIARDLFKTGDPAILSAIECHTTLKAGPSDLDMVLFIADKLSWDQAGTPPFYNAVSTALGHSLGYACLVYINFILENGMVLSPHRWLLDAKHWIENPS